MNAKQYSEQIKADASALLAETGYIEILSKYGEVHIVGSFPANLMWDPDVDLVVVTESPRQAAVQFLQEIISKRQFQKYEFGDFEKFPRAHRPESFIVNAQREWAGQVWEIETWFMEDAQDKIDLVEKLNSLDEEKKMQILEEKRKRAESGTTKHQLSSFEIYKKYLRDI